MGAPKSVTVGMSICQFWLSFAVCRKFVLGFFPSFLGFFWRMCVLDCQSCCRTLFVCEMFVALFPHFGVMGKKTR